jgi:hypothetical protein
VIRLIGRVGRLYSYVSQRRIAATGTYAWGLWLLAWIPLYVLFSWLLDIGHMVYGDA